MPTRKTRKFDWSKPMDRFRFYLEGAILARYYFRATHDTRVLNDYNFWRRRAIGIIRQLEARLGREPRPTRLLKPVMPNMTELEYLLSVREPSV